MLFDETQHGKPISEQLSQYLRDWTSKQDYANVFLDTGVSQSTIRDVIHRTNNLTENNSKAILEMMKVAVKNCTNKIEYAKRVKKEFEKCLPDEQAETNISV